MARVAVLAFVLALVAAACGGGGEGDTITLDDDGLTPPAGDAPVRETETPEIFGDRVDFTYEAFGGAELAFSDLGNQPTVINFFASWCPTCIAELPDFERVFQTLGSEVQFLGLSVQDDPALSLQLLEDTGVTFPTGLDTPGELFSAFGGLGMPTTVFIDADGQVIDVHTGVLTESSLTDAIEENLL